MRFEPSKFKDKLACVLGLGRSGLAAANLLADRGFKVFVSEKRTRTEAAEDIRRLHYHVALEAGGHSGKVFRSGFLVKSPGIPSGAPVLAEARKRGIPVFSEVEVGLAFAPTGRVFAVTGTNGKTTTTRLLGDVLAADGRRVAVAGNIGKPVCSVVDELCVGDSLVLEVSSYQLEDSAWFRPAAACVLNLTPDHVDHHGTLDAYAAAKARVFAMQGKGDLCAFFADDAGTAALAKACPSRALLFGMKARRGLHAWADGGRLKVRLGGRSVTLTPPALPGAHNLQNAMAAALMAMGAGVPASSVQKGFDGFKGVEHRIEDVGVFKGVRFVNDSKATNVDSTLVALKSFPARRNIVLILGGLDKGSPYAPLLPEMKRRVKALLTIGSAAPKIESELGKAFPPVRCGTLARAVETALKDSRRGDVVLLSPACASFDQFKDYEDRGRAFKRLIHDRIGS